MAKRGHYDPDDMAQYGSAAPSVQLGPDDRQRDGATFAVPKGRAPRAKPKKPLGAPSVASGSVAGREGDSDSQLQVSDSRVVSRMNRKEWRDDQVKALGRVCAHAPDREDRDNGGNRADRGRRV